MFSIKDRRYIRGILNSMTCTGHFSENFNSVFNEKNREKSLCFCSIACKKRTDVIFYFNNKNSLYRLLILTLQVFKSQSCEAGTKLVMKPFGIPQTLRRRRLSQKNASFFSNPLLFFIYYFRQYLP